MEKYLKKIFQGFKKYFITGFLLILPLWVTIYVLWIFIGIVGSLVSPILKGLLIDKVPYFSIRIMSFVSSIIIIWIFGIITANILGKKLLQKFEDIIKKMPIIKEIYNSSKQFIKFLTTKNVNFKYVVLFEFPRKGIYTIGFITNDNKINISSKNYLSVFYPTTPNISTGFFLLVPEDEIIYPDLSIETAIKMIISAGVLGEEIKIKNKQEGDRT